MSDKYTKQPTRTGNSYAVGMTLPLDILKKLDDRRGDIPRSRFFLRAIENYLAVSEGAAATKQTK